MTAQEQLTLKTLLLHNRAADASGSAAYRLLNDLGHEVATTDSADQAVELLQSDRADLVVIDADAKSQSDFVARLFDLPADLQPRQVAIFSDAANEGLTHLVDRLQRGKVHVLLKPLHMHGLLSVLRHIESKGSSFTA
jgi:DNA-binding NtrC family response regulator